MIGLRYPVLIGSRALCYYDKSLLQSKKNSDWDFIIDSKANKNKFEGDNKHWYSHSSGIYYDAKRLDIVARDTSDYYCIIFDTCNDFFADLKCLLVNIKIGTKNTEVIVPPLEILYAIKKGHIHRIINYQASMYQNVNIWYEHLAMYLWMRNQLGYQRMDSMIYSENYGPPLSKNKTIGEDILTYCVRKIFLLSFDNTNSKNGDTKNKMNQKEEEFFVDNITRYIEHDALHMKVANMCRDTDELLFKRYQSNPNSVEMDKDLFINAERKDQIQTIIEEIIVLLLERKIIPELVRSYKDRGVIYKGFDKKEITEQIREIISHFVCNLCGDGHYWLRRWCLDHLSFFTNMDIYDFSKIDMLAIEISGVKVGQNTYPNIDDSLVDIVDFINMKTFLCVNPIFPTEHIKNGGNILTNKSNHLFKASDNMIQLKCIMMINVSTLEDITFNFYYDKDSDIILRILRLFSDSDGTLYLYVDNNMASVAFYDINKNIGLTYSDKISIFKVIDIDQDYKDDKLNYSIGMINLDGMREEYSKKYVKKYYRYYYYSSDPSCGGMDAQRNDFSKAYLASYGFLPHAIGSMFDIFARHSQNILFDESRLESWEKQTSDNESIYSDGDNSNDSSKSDDCHYEY